MVRARFGFAVALGIGMAVVMLIVAAVYDVPVRDPDSGAGATYLRFPAILGLAFLTDVLPRAVRRMRGLRDLPRSFADVTRERWTWSHVRFALVGLGSWYITYFAFRNLKSFVPFVNPHLNDNALSAIDRALLFGHDPAVVLHDLLGTGFAAHFLSFIYVAWIVFVPVSLAIALVWTRNLAAGAWFVTAVAVDWVLGVATYYALPSLGPIYVRPGQFEDLPTTWVSQLQDAMMADRADVLANPFATGSVQTIAAFASLHVAITVTGCLMAELLRLPKLLRAGLWVFLGLTVLSTIYLGWHYLTDAVGGAALGAVAVAVAAWATGNRLRRPALNEVREHEPETTDSPAPSR